MGCYDAGMDTNTSSTQERKRSRLPWYVNAGLIVFGLLFALMICGLLVPQGGAASQRVLVPTATPGPTPTWTYEERKANAIAVSFADLVDNPKLPPGFFMKAKGRVLDVGYVDDPSVFAWQALITDSPKGHTASRAILICLECGIALPNIGDEIDVAAVPTGEVSRSGYHIQPGIVAPVLWVVH